MNTHTAVRALPLRTAITDGESVDSWLEQLARRHRLTPRALLPALGISALPAFTSKLIYGVDPRLWRQIEQVTGLVPGRLDTAVGDPRVTAIRLRPGGSRYCPRCLADTHGRWLLSWRRTWTVACRSHRMLLHDSCAACHATPRRKLPGGVKPIPPGSCTHILLPSRRQRCGTDLTTAAVIPVNDDVLDVQRWIDDLITRIGQPDGHPNREYATTVLADLPLVVSWLLLDHRAALLATAGRINANRPTDRDTGWHSLDSLDAALTAAVLAAARTIVDGADQAAVTALREIFAKLPTKRRIPPPGMSTAHWQALSTRFRNRYLRAADPDLLATERLRLRTVTPAAREPGGKIGGRIRQIPQLLWPDWSARLLPVSGFHPELFRAAFSISLLIPGHPGKPGRDLPALTTQFNPRVRRANITTMFAELADQLGSPGLRDVLTLLCRIAEHLDQIGAPIDYQRRREQILTETLTWDQWRDLVCSAAAHPGDRNPNGRLLLAQRHLHQLITGADLSDPRHPLAFRNAHDRNRYILFTTKLTTPLRQALHEHAIAVLAELGIDEPLLWSPPAGLADGLQLPGIDIHTLDMTTVNRLVVEQHRSPGDTARELGVHLEHIRLALERLDRPQRQWAHNSTPTAWHTEQHAARVLTRDFFDREYIHKGRTLNELAETTGIGRHIIARIAKQLDVPLNKGRAPFPIDPDWLREQYGDRLRPTADIAAELGTDQMTVNHALHRLDIPTRPSGVGSFPQMIAVLDKDVPRDIRAAVEGALHGWQRLHRFQIAMTFPSIDTAATYLGAHQSSLVHQFQRLERDIGTQLYRRATFHKPHRPTPRGQALLRHLAHQHIQHLMTAALGDQIRPMPAPDTITAAHQHLSRQPRKPPPRTPIPHTTTPRKQPRGTAAHQIRITPHVRTVLHDIIDHPGEFYGLEVFNRTGIDQSTLYPMLHRLHRAGWLTSHLEDEQSWLAGAPPGRGPGRRRTYYYSSRRS
ncbi:TniQ family protein [Kibdelosporangium philippinense]|uniref:TniQ family protein n=1 Tax=Kibdelosporangium philippinense TaxID=211113 RepID=A0ABS8ZR79_9PSEU|nr:TniQ family protein [Kibdelosporangium philippinense]MCE7010074.1 TniQ family protein [Kibdelosporangium philippinense]